MSNDILKTKKELIEIGRQIAAKGLVIGPGGNISARTGGSMVISASGSSFETSTEDDYVAVDIATGKAEEGAKRPSSEVLMHLECYRRRPEINAVVHTHPTWSTSVASAGIKMPPMFPDYVVFVGDPATLDYVIPTTKLLADAVGGVIADHIRECGNPVGLDLSKNEGQEVLRGRRSDTTSCFWTYPFPGLEE